MGESFVRAAPHAGIDVGIDRFGRATFAAFVELVAVMDIRTVSVTGLELRVATSRPRPGTLPLFFFNGIGANLDLLRGFADEMSARGIGIIVIDVPGTGGSDAPSSPYRLSWLAKLADDVLVRLSILGQVDVGGVSWGGALAQEFAHRFPARVRRLMLAATSAGAVSSSAWCS